MKTKEPHPLEPLVEQAELKEPCPCGSKKVFGGCCGDLNECDCGSQLIASDCCYDPTKAQASLKKMG